jgi:hypothetical protein
VLNGGVGNAFDISFYADVGHNGDGIPPPTAEFRDQYAQRTFAACRDDDPRPAPDGCACGGETDATRRAGDDDDLIRDSL